jgi:hypothetical protein
MLDEVGAAPPATWRVAQKTQTSRVDDTCNACQYKRPQPSISLASSYPKTARSPHGFGCAIEMDGGWVQKSLPIKTRLLPASREARVTRRRTATGLWLEPLIASRTPQIVILAADSGSCAVYLAIGRYDIPLLGEPVSDADGDSSTKK